MSYHRESSSCSSSSSSPPNYMDKVPVKISEKYKPPPKVTIPQTIINRLNSDGYPIGIFDYDFTLENNVNKKIDEWKKFRQLALDKRQERIRQYEIENARQIEQKQKQLLTAVSYPNAEDLSSSSDDDGGHDDKSSSQKNSTLASGNNNNSSVDVKSHLQKSNNKSTNGIQQQQFSPLQQQCFDTILMPTVIPDSSTTNNKTAKNIFQQENQQNQQSGSPGLNKTIISKINYSDFENDTSSPFDNIELKTINDLDVLAQVLNVTQIHSKPNDTVVVVETSSTKSTNLSSIDQTNKISQNLDNNITNINNDYYRNSTNNTPTSGELLTTRTSIGTNNLSSSQQQQQQWIANTANTINIDNRNNIDQIVHHSIGGNYHNHQTNLYCPTNNLYYPSYKTSSSAQLVQQQQNYANMNGISGGGNAAGGIDNQSGGSCIGGQQQINNFYYNYDNLPSNQNYLYNRSYPVDNNLESSINNTYSSYKHENYVNLQQQEQQTIPIQSNIFQYNLDNINNDSRLLSQCTNMMHDDGGSEYDRNCAIQSAKNKSKSVPDILQELNNEIRDSEIRRARNHSQTLEDHFAAVSSENIEKSTRRPEVFMKLSPSLQCLVKNISSMGFPLELVSKIAAKLGSDDKKIVEHLIPLSELLDLGFDETKISDALLKFDNNKEKALDFLIS